VGLGVRGRQVAEDGVVGRRTVEAVAVRGRVVERVAGDDGAGVQVGAQNKLGVHDPVHEGEGLLFAAVVEALVRAFVELVGEVAVQINVVGIVATCWLKKEGAIS